MQSSDSSLSNFNNCNDYFKRTFDKIESKNKIDPSVNIYIRSANNCECKCNICATCMSDEIFFGIVSSHLRIIDCKCCVCEKYRNENFYKQSY